MIYYRMDWNRFAGFDVCIYYCGNNVKHKQNLDVAMNIRNKILEELKKLDTLQIVDLCKHINFNTTKNLVFLRKIIQKAKFEICRNNYKSISRQFLFTVGSNWWSAGTFKESKYEA